MPLSKEEIELIKRILGHEPRAEELAMFESQWSEHCSYKSSRLLLKLLPSHAKHVIIGPGRDAPAVEVFPGVAIVFKIESHNHPSAVDPYNGAATGIGGIVRDILTLGAKPIALLDLLYLGNPRDPHANWLVRNIVKGISDYGNRIGVPTVAGDTWFDKSFNKQPLVNVACIGLVETKKLLTAAPEPGDLILVVGNSTGRDGLLGSSFASRPLSEDTDKDLGAVQVGDPLIEKLLIDVIDELVNRNLVKYIKDLGGGGLTTAISETAADYNLGVEIYLDKLHVRESDLTPLELLVSESQERMLIVTDRSRLRQVVELLEHYEVPYSIIGSFNNSGRIKVYYKEKLVADVPAKDLAHPPALERPYKPPVKVIDLWKSISIPEPNDIADAIVKVFGSLNIVSRRWIYEQYDYGVGIRTVLEPGRADAAVLRLLDGTNRGIAVKGDANPRYTSIDPFRGGANAVAECFRNLVAVGSEPLAIVDELNAGNPEKPEHYWFFAQMVKGVAWMADELKLPVVGGKVSFYNENERGEQVKPTTTIVGIGRIHDVSKTLTIDLKEHGSSIMILGTTYPELGASEYLYVVHGIEAGEVPIPRPSLELRVASLMRQLIRNNYVKSAHDISVGGLIVALLEMAVTGGLGLNIDLSKVPTRGIRRLDELLFSESQARYLIEIDEGNVDKILKLASEYNVEASVIGKVVDKNHIELRYNSRKITVLDLEFLAELYYNNLGKAIEG